MEPFARCRADFRIVLHGEHSFAKRQLGHPCRDLATEPIGALIRRFDIRYPLNPDPLPTKCGNRNWVPG